MTHLRALPLWLSLVVAVPGMAQRPFPPDSFTNLKVLPKTIPANELVALMGSFTRALGVRCTFCHVGREDQALNDYDFPSDEKPTKRKAREMLRMVKAINEQYLANLEVRLDPPVRVECFTCHRGVREPRTLQDILVTAYRTVGFDSTVATYRALRERYYGRAVYDFSEVALTQVAGAAATAGKPEDAARFTAMNVDVNPASSFAKRQHAFRATAAAYELRGADQGAATYRELKQKYGDAVTEETLNSVGYALLARSHPREAVAALKMNVELYPDSWNAYDSLGEGYVAVGDTTQAIANYERSVKLNPGNGSGRLALQKLRGAGR